MLVATDGNGNKVVIIPQIIFKGKRSISWKDVEKYLIRYVGKIIEVSETEDLIYIDRLFVDEYSGSTYTKKLVGALPKVKANMSQGITEMIEIATDKRWKEDFEKKHGKKAGNGWFRYNTRFAFLGVLIIVNESKFCILLTSNSAKKNKKYESMQVNITLRIITDGV